MKCQRRLKLPPNISVSQSIASGHNPEEKENRKVYVNISKHVSNHLNRRDETMRNYFTLSHPGYTYPLAEDSGRRRLVLSLRPTCCSSISGHQEGKFWPVSNGICVGKGHLLWGAGRAPPHSCQSTANQSYERHKTVRKIVCRNPSRREQSCAMDCVSLPVEWFGGKNRNNGLIFSGLRALPCFYHNGSLNLPRQMGTGCGILQSSFP